MRSPFEVKRLYKIRARIKQTFGKMKRGWLLVLRCEKTSHSYASFMAIVCAFVLIKSVHTA